MKILVTGAKGQLGYDILKDLEAHGISCKGIDRSECDITDQNTVFHTIIDYLPNTVIHCAAYTAVDKAEDEPELCRKINEKGTRNIAQACKQIDATMIYISTDYVFKGCGNHFHRTSDPTDPVSVYGRTKLAGEKATLDIVKHALVIRTSWLFGLNGNNFVKTMLRLGCENQNLSVVCNQIGSPTYSVDLATLIRKMATKNIYGVYHVTNEGICSWAEFAKEIFQISGLNVHVNSILANEYPSKACRPLNSRLDKTCLDNIGFSRLPHWKDALERYLKSSS